MHVLVISLLVPLALLFSINAKALDVDNSYGFLDNGVLETPIELSSIEANPDLDHPLIASFEQITKRRYNVTRIHEAVSKTSTRYEVTCCRDPPKLG